MVNHQNLLALDGSLISDPFNLDLDYYHIGNPEDMPFDELERLFEDQSSQPSIDLSSDLLDLPSKNAPPNSSLSPGDTDAQLTPSSTADELPPDESNVDVIPIDFGTEYTNSPNEPFEQISPYSSRSDDYLYVSPSIPHSINGGSPFAHGSRESTSGLVSDLTQQQWPSFNTLASDTLASDISDQLGTPQYHGFNDAAAASICLVQLCRSGPYSTVHRGHLQACSQTHLGHLGAISTTRPIMCKTSLLHSSWHHTSQLIRVIVFNNHKPITPGAFQQNQQSHTI
jgi:hypothetical protein